MATVLQIPVRQRMIVQQALLQTQQATHQIRSQIVHQFAGLWLPAKYCRENIELLWNVRWTGRCLIYAQIIIIGYTAAGSRCWGRACATTTAG